MKILYVITKGNWGGAQKYVFEMATHLPKPEFEVKVACGEGETLPAKLDAASIPVIRMQKLGRDVHFAKDISVFFDLISLYKKERPDIVHLNSSKIGGIGALAARLAGIKKIIFTVHGFAFNEQRPWWQKQLIILVSWLTIVFSTDVIFISEVEKNRASRWPFMSKKIHVIYNGIESPAFLSRTQAREQLASIINQPVSIFEHKLVVMTIGELTMNKGYRYAIEAVQHIPDIVYLIVGQGELRTELEQLVTDLKLGTQVFFAGFVKDASTLLPAADVFLLPSLKEGMPYVILEAGYASLPVIATDVGGIREIINDTTSGIVIPPRSTAALQKALFISQQQPEKLASYGEQLNKHIATIFTLKNMVDNTVALYHENTL